MNAVGFVKVRVFLLGCALVFMVGCLNRSPVTSPPIVAKRTQMHMGTLVTLTAVAPSKAMAQAVMTAGFHEVKRLEQLLSTWIPESELSRVNAAAGETPVHVSRETLELVTRSLEMARLTEGGFNIAIGPAVELLEYRRSDNRFPARLNLSA